MLERCYKYFRYNFYDDPSGLKQLTYTLKKNEYDTDVEVSQFLMEKVKYISLALPLTENKS